MPDPFFVKGSATSEAAAESTKKKRLPHARRIFDRLIVGSFTCEELEDALGIPHQTCSARLAGLTRAGCIQPSGQTRKTRSDSASIVHEILPDAPFELYRIWCREDALTRSARKALLELAQSFSQACLDVDEKRRLAEVQGLDDAVDEKKRLAAAVLMACQKAYPEGGQ